THKRTARDGAPTPDVERRTRSAPFLVEKARTPGLKTPVLVPSYQGSSDELLLTLPQWAVDDPELSPGYKSLIASLRPRTRFVVVHAKSSGAAVKSWCKAAGHPAGNVTYVPLADYVSFTDWAEDGYVSLADA